MTPTLVKLGGSAAFAPTLRHWLAMLAGGGGSVCVVPGGGPFSDAVRLAQPQMGFADAAAHRMAILGMEQYAHALSGLCPSLRAVATPAELAASASDGVPSLWYPARMLIGARGLAPSWALTSDSLAVWLAGQIGAACVVLVKQADPGSDGDVAALSRRGFVDEALPQMLRDWPVRLYVAGPAAREPVRRFLADGNDHGLLALSARRGAA